MKRCEILILLHILNPLLDAPRYHAWLAYKRLISWKEYQITHLFRSSEGRIGASMILLLVLLSRHSEYPWKRELRAKLNATRLLQNAFRFSNEVGVYNYK